MRGLVLGSQEHQWLIGRGRLRRWADAVNFFPMYESVTGNMGISLGGNGYRKTVPRLWHGVYVMVVSLRTCGSRLDHRPMVGRSTSRWRADKLGLECPTISVSQAEIVGTANLSWLRIFLIRGVDVGQWTRVNNDLVPSYLGRWQELQLIPTAIFLVSLIRHSK